MHLVGPVGTGWGRMGGGRDGLDSDWAHQAGLGRMGLGVSGVGAAQYLLFDPIVLVVVIAHDSV